MQLFIINITMIISNSLVATAGAGMNFIVSDFYRNSGDYTHHNEHRAIDGFCNVPDNILSLHERLNNDTNNTNMFDSFELSNLPDILYGHQMPYYFLRTFEDIRIDEQLVIQNIDSAWFIHTLLIIKNYLVADFSTESSNWKLYNMLDNFFKATRNCESSPIHSGTGILTSEFTTANIPTASPLFIYYLIEANKSNTPLSISEFHKFNAKKILSCRPFAPTLLPEYADRFNRILDVEYETIFFDLDFPECNLFKNISKLKVAEYSRNNINDVREFINVYLPQSVKEKFIERLNQYESRLSVAVSKIV